MKAIYMDEKALAAGAAGSNLQVALVGRARVGRGAEHVRTHVAAPPARAAGGESAWSRLRRSARCLLQVGLPRGSAQQGKPSGGWRPTAAPP